MDNNASAETATPTRDGLGVRVARIAGVDIALDATLIIVFALVTAQLALGVLPAWHPNWSALEVGIVAVVAAASFLASILAHEAAHAIVANLTGTRVRRITLLLFGGIAELDHEPRTPRAELAMTIVGPLVSLAIGAAATALGLALAPKAVPLLPTHPQMAYADLGPIATILMWLGPVNIWLGLFNLLPGFPLDGGRLLRAAIWWATGDLRRATRWASLGGRIAGGGLILLGIFTLLSGAVASGLWTALIGWFLHGAATRGYRQLIVQDALEGVRVDRVMRGSGEVVSPFESIERVVHDHFVANDERTVPIVDHGALVGVVVAHDVRRIPRDSWPETSVASVMTPALEVPTVDVDAPASEALEKLASTGYDQLPVVESGIVRGVVRLRDLLRWISVADAEAARL